MQGLRLCFGALFGIRLPATLEQLDLWKCRFAGITDDIERSLRVFKMGGGVMQFGQLRVQKKKARVKLSGT